MSKIKCLSNGTVNTIYFSLDRPNNDYYLPLSINGKLEYAFTCTASSPIISNLRLFNNGIKKYILGPPSSFYSTAATFSTSITYINEPLYNSNSKYFIGYYFTSPGVMPTRRLYLNSPDYGITWSSCHSIVGGLGGIDTIVKTDNNYYYLIEPSGTNIAIYKSITGSVWTTAGSAISAGYISGDFGTSIKFFIENNKFFVVTKNTTITTNSIIYSSPIDTISWATSYSPFMDSAYTIHQIIGDGNTNLLMKLYNGSYVALMSSINNGTSWEVLMAPGSINNNLPGFLNTYNLTYGNKRFISFFNSSGQKSFCINTSDLQNFTTDSILKSNQLPVSLTNAKFSNGVFYSTYYVGTVASIYRSSDALSWETFTSSVSVGGTIGSFELFEGGVLLGIGNSKVYKTETR